MPFDMHSNAGGYSGNIYTSSRKKTSEERKARAKSGLGPGECECGWYTAKTSRKADLLRAHKEKQCRLGKAAVRAVDFDDSEEAPSGSESDNAGAFDVSQENCTSDSEYESDAGKF